MSRWSALRPLVHAKPLTGIPRATPRSLLRHASNAPRPAARPASSSNGGAGPGPQYARYTPGMGSFALYIVSLASALTAGYFISPLSQGLSAQPFAPHLIPSDEATALQKLNQPRYGTHPDYLAAIKELETLFAGKDGRVSTDVEDLEAHGISEWSYHEAKMPTVVVWAESTEEVKKIVDIARKWRVPITPFSGGTSLEGHFSSPYGGISLDLSLMDKVLQVSEADGDCIVQSGVKWEDVNAHLAAKGIKLFFPLDPGPGATIGGMVGTGCSGTNAVRYGTAKAEWFLNLTVVLPSGEIIKTRQRARKSSAGWDTTKLFVGAEGTLGIVTEATLRLAPLLPTKVAVVGFPGVEEAVAAATEIVNLGMPVQCVEFLDKKTVQAVNEGGLAGRKFPLRDSLFFKFQGSDASMTEVAKRVKEVAGKHGGANLEFSRTDKEAHDLWQGRKAALWSIMGLVPGAKAWTTDVCVPISKLPQLVKETSEDFDKRGITAAHLGHVGDGNVHSILLFSNDDELHRIEEGVHAMVHRAIRLDGTCTGEHGVGIGKIEYLTEELGLGTVNLMETVKRTIDPLNIMNPGKLYPNIKPIKP